MLNLLDKMKARADFDVFFKSGLLWQILSGFGHQVIFWLSKTVLFDLTCGSISYKYIHPEVRYIITIVKAETITDDYFLAKIQGV